MAECTDVKQDFESAEMCASNESQAVKGNAKNSDLIGNLDKVSGNIDSRGNWKRA